MPSQADYINTDILKHAILNPIQLRFAELGRCYKCKSKLERVPVSGHPEFSPWQCSNIKCQTVYFLQA